MPATQDERVTFREDPEVVDVLDEQLEYGDSRSEFIREAVREKLSRDHGVQVNGGAA
jgi:metal-responsive CopG/Arc/MetJ family transcriptional regulator